MPAELAASNRAARAPVMPHRNKSSSSVLVDEQGAQPAISGGVKAPRWAKLRADHRSRRNNSSVDAEPLIAVTTGNGKRQIDAPTSWKIHGGVPRPADK